jgi:hypothetical protein
MARLSHIYSINFTGGIISPGYLQEVLSIATAAQVTQVRFGLRQQLYVEVQNKHCKQFETACRGKHIVLSQTPNISSSYAATDIFIPDSWLTEGIYKDIFDLFETPPKLKINICDSQQTFVPFFTGHINWIASSHAHYWYLYIRMPGQQSTYCWPELIYTNSIPQVSRFLEEHMTHIPEKLCDYIGRPKDKELEPPVFHLPYYEGFNKYNNQYWLGIYRRDEEFSVAFLKDLCSICLETGVGQLYATSWKSIIVRDIDPAHRRLWDYALGKHGINVRHAANELNWQIADNCEDSLILKRHIIRHFDTADVRTYGLCFSIRMQPGNSHFGAIVIRKQENKYNSKLKYMQRFDILYTADFNPNSSAMVLYRENVTKEHLGPYIVSLCKHYYEKGSEWDILQQYVAEQQHTPVNSVPEKMVLQCPCCKSIYEEGQGEQCYICETDVSEFNEVPFSTLIQTT